MAKLDQILQIFYTLHFILGPAIWHAVGCLESNPRFSVLPKDISKCGHEEEVSKLSEPPEYYMKSLVLSLDQGTPSKL